MAYSEALYTLMEELAEKLIAKHHDYGTGNLLKDGQYGVVVRCSDKVERLRQVLKNGGRVSDETIENTWLDLAGYALQALLLRRGELREEIDQLAYDRAASLHCPRCGNGLILRTWMGDVHDLASSIYCPTCQVSTEFDPEIVYSKGGVTALILERFLPASE